LTKIPIVNISELERRLKKFVMDLRKIGIEPVITHEKEERSVLILIDVNDLVNILRKRVEYANVDFYAVHNHIVVVINY